MPLASFSKRGDGYQSWCKGCHNAYLRFTRYGISPGAFDRMLAEQDHKCAILGEPITAKTCHIDHDRKCCPGRISCGKCIRGLLCFTCNTMVSWLENHEFVYRSNIYLTNYANRRRGPEAQLDEQRATNAKGAGSTPAGASIITAVPR